MRDIYETITRPLTEALEKLSPNVREGTLKLEIDGRERVLWFDLTSTTPYTTFTKAMDAFAKGVLAASGVDIFANNDFRVAYETVSRVLHTYQEQMRYR